MATYFMIKLAISRFFLYICGIKCNYYGKTNRKGRRGGDPRNAL